MTIDVSKIKAGDTVTVTLNDGFTGTGEVHESSADGGHLYVADSMITLRQWNGEIARSIKSIDDWQPKAPEWHTDPDIIAIKIGEETWYRQAEGDMWQMLNSFILWPWQDLLDHGPVTIHGRRV